MQCSEHMKLNMWGHRAIAKRDIKMKRFDFQVIDIIIETLKLLLTLTLRT